MRNIIQRFSEITPTTTTINHNVLRSRWRFAYWLCHLSCGKMFNQRRLVARAIAHRSREHGNSNLAVVVARSYKPQASVMDNLYSRHLKCHAAAAVDAPIEAEERLKMHLFPWLVKVRVWNMEKPYFLTDWSHSMMANDFNEWIQRIEEKKIGLSVGFGCHNGLGFGFYSP